MTWRGVFSLLMLAGCSDPSAPASDASPNDAATDLDVAQVEADADAASPSSVPADPIAYTKDTPFTVGDSYVYVPSSYDDTHQTPTTLFVWLHGCGGFASGDIWTISPGGDQSWHSHAVGGQEGNCWDVDNDPAHVLAAVADMKTHFNVKPKGVVLGGYSSGGDLTYRTIFYDAKTFAGALIENSSPYRDTGSSESASLGAASWKFNVVHLAHLQDQTYPIDGVRTETDSMSAAGFPMKRIEVDGAHYDDPGAIENGHAVPGTSADLQTYLLPYLDAGWTAP
jgi:poly(3-hydroxybutyrate) depolymerase